VAFVLWTAARDYEREMRRQGLIYADDQYHYAPQLVKAALPVALAYRHEQVEPSWPTGDEEQSGARSKNDPAEGNNLTAIMLDVLAGFDGLSAADRMLLLRCHLDGLTLDQVAAERQDEPAAVRKAHSRAVDRLIERLGGQRRREGEVHDGPGARQVLSNAAARAITE
jgi:DNA-directed RNA polymerase specialized sigma24 family protein